MAQMTPLATIMNQTPQVSVVMPNLNNRRFLPERLDSIVNQTLTDWEAIIVDSYSDDGAWELIQAYAARDRRFRIAQAPRDGIYPNLNRSIAQARGEYVYIATSDDTMAPECLAKMVTAMDAHPECGLCHACLQVIDEDGEDIPNWWQNTLPVKFYGDWMRVPHLRSAPHDGILHCALESVYISLTQLLIRRTVFDEVGLFRADWGAVSDFEWDVRASLLTNVLHLPETVATWRIHAGQATTRAALDAAQGWRQRCAMLEAAFEVFFRKRPAWRQIICPRRLFFPYRQVVFWKTLVEPARRAARMRFIAYACAEHPRLLGEFLLARLFGIYLEVDRVEYIRQEVRRLGLEQAVTRVSL